MRRICYGYGYGEVPLPSLGEDPDTSAFGKKIRKKDLVKRGPVLVSLGCHVDGAALPRPDLGDPVFLAAGEMKRIMAPLTETVDFEEISGPFTDFVRTEVQRDFVALSHDQILTFEEWLESTNYPEWRKEELRKVRDELPNAELTDLVELWWREISCFMKDESYIDWKYPRPIHAAVDQIKVVLGPIVRSVEKVVFQHDDFIKKVPLDERPAFIEEKLHVEGCRNFSADASSWEARQIKEFMLASEMVMYQHMLSAWPNTNLLYKRVLTKIGENHIRNKFFSLLVVARRMSGEMDTSLANGTNMRFLIRYLCMKKGSTVVKGVYEGDDSLVVCDGPLPSAADFERLNVKIEINYHEDVNEASFCGMVYDKQDLANIPDPRECVVSFGWTTRDYVGSKQSVLDKLLVAKAYSYLSAYSGCPVLQPLALTILSVVNHDRDELYNFVSQHMVINMYERELILLALKKSPKPRQIGVGSRHMMEKIYGFTVPQQLVLEAYIEQMLVDRKIRPIPLELVAPLPSSWVDYYSGFCEEVDVSDYSGLYYPPGLARPLVHRDGFVEQTPFGYKDMHAPV